MPHELTDLLGCEHPLLAFSHCRDVVAAVTNAGGFGVYGVAAHEVAALELDLVWIDRHVAGRPYGVDVVVAESYEGKADALDADALAGRVPPQHQDFAADVLRAHGIDPVAGLGPPPLHPTAQRGEELLDVCFRHPIRLVANALGVPPASMIERAHRHDVPVAALVGTAAQAVRQVEAGVDLVVAQGTEAGGHCGEVSTLVLVPEVIAALQGGRRVPVLAAGGIMTGRQMAAALALGAAGVWTGSVWLTTDESDTPPHMKQRLIEAGSRDVVRSRSRTGKPCRQLRSDWTQAWDTGDGPAPLPMPLQGMVSEPALARVDDLAARGHGGAQALATYLVGQGVGLMTRQRPARDVVLSMVEEMVDTIERLGRLLED